MMWCPELPPLQEAGLSRGSAAFPQLAVAHLAPTPERRLISILSVSLRQFARAAPGTRSQISDRANVCTSHADSAAISSTDPAQKLLALGPRPPSATKASPSSSLWTRQEMDPALARGGQAGAGARSQFSVSGPEVGRDEAPGPSSCTALTLPRTCAPPVGFAHKGAHARVLAAKY